MKRIHGVGAFPPPHLHVRCPRRPKKYREIGYELLEDVPVAGVSDQSKFEQSGMSYWRMSRWRV